MNKKNFLFFLFIIAAVVTFQAQARSISEKMMQFQIFLDENNFSPGKIDGLDGQFTQQALKYYKEAHPGELSKDHIKTGASLYKIYTIKQKDKDYIGTLPKKLAAQAKQKKLFYTNYAEFVAERYHVDLNFLAKINPNQDLNKLKTGASLIVPNVEPFQIEDLYKDEKPKKSNEFSNRSIKINTKKEMLFLYEEDVLIAAFPITAGSTNLPAPKGQWTLKSITYLPWFRYDKKMLIEGKRSSNYYMLPPGPNNLVGVVWMGLNKVGIGIHGTDHPETIGRTTSHGCIRLSNWDAVKLSKMITPGIKVQIE